MSLVHSELPTKKTGHVIEHIEAIHLKNLESDKIHLWFDLSDIPDVYDTDMLLWHENIGLFLIEQKGIRLDDIEEFSYRNCKIKNRSLSRSPQHQAREAMIALRNFMQPRIKGRLPWMVPTVFWPRITSREWSSKMNNPDIAGLASRMIFQDDLQIGIRHFEEKLRYIFENPPVGTASKDFINANSFSIVMLEQFKHILDPTSKPKPTISDIERLDKLEANIRSDIRKEWPKPNGQRIIFRGHPGTGKTFRLLELGVHYIQQGYSTIYLCYNKVLATDLRRLMNFSDTFQRFPDAKRLIRIFDIFQLMSYYASMYSISINDDDPDYDAWARIVINEIKKEQKSIEKFDAIFVDEGQDLPDWCLDLVDLLKKEDAAIFVAQGNGQELYNRPNAESIRWDSLEGATIKQLRRVFRNSKASYFVAQSFYDHAPKKEKIESLYNKFREKSDEYSSKIIEFDRDDAIGPLLFRIQDDIIWSKDPSEVDFAELQESHMSTEIMTIIEKEFLKIRENHEPIDLLILVPDTTSGFTKWTKLALSKINELEYIDYTVDDQRRLQPKNEQVRLCTFHSSRGIEARQVVLIGFESIDTFCSKISNKPIYNNLGYVILSRSLNSTTITKTSMYPPQKVFSFLEESLYFANKLS